MSIDNKLDLLNRESTMPIKEYNKLMEAIEKHREMKGKFGTPTKEYQDALKKEIKLLKQQKELIDSEIEQIENNLNERK